MSKTNEVTRAMTDETKKVDSAVRHHAARHQDKTASAVDQERGELADQGTHEHAAGKHGSGCCCAGKDGK